MEPINPNQNPDIKIVGPQPAPRRRRISRWLTLAALVLLTGSGSVYWLLRDNSQVVQAAPAAVVEITADGFSPQTVRIKQGQSITWVNEDSSPHQIASAPFPSDDTLPDLNSDEPLVKNDSFSATLEQPGIFNYHDQLDPVGSKGTIIVE